MVLVQADRDVRIRFERRFHHLAQKRFAGILAGAGRRLQNDRAVAGVRRLHDGENLFKVIDVECGHTVLAVSCMIEQLA